MRNLIEPLPKHDAVRIRAAHRVPSFSVAVEGAYQFLGALVLGGSTRAIRVVALPNASSFTVDLVVEYDASRQQVSVDVDLPRYGVGGMTWLSDLTALSEEVRLRVAAEYSLIHADVQPSSPLKHPDVLFEGRWSLTHPLLEEDTATSVHAVVTTGLRARMCQMNQKILHTRNRMEIVLLFTFIAMFPACFSVCLSGGVAKLEAVIHRTDSVQDGTL